MISRVAMLGLVWVLAGAVSCANDGFDEKAPVNAPATIRVSSSAFDDGAPIPGRFTCDGEGTAPSLTWTGVPEDAAALALVVDDPDAPGGTFVHWVVLDLPAQTASLDDGRIPAGAAQAKGSSGQSAYVPPCPPSGSHHHRFTVYALSDRTGLADGVDTDRALQAVASTAAAQGRLVGTYARGG